MNWGRGQELELPASHSVFGGAHGAEQGAAGWARVGWMLMWRVLHLDLRMRPSLSEVQSRASRRRTMVSAAETRKQHAAQVLSPPYYAACQALILACPS